MLIEDLQKLGLNDKEAKVYLAMLELEKGTIQRISLKSGIKRTTLYDVIDSLQDKGLVGLTKKGRKTLYYAEDPLRLEQQLDEKRLVLKSVLPEILSITNKLEKKPKIRFFEGINGIKQVYKDTLNYPDQEILAWASQEAVTHFDVDWLWKTYIPSRLEKKIWTRVIAPDNEEIRNLQTFDEKHLRKIRLAREAIFDVEINLYGKQNIAIMSFEEKTGLIIESKKIYNTLKSIFEMNWKMLE